MLTRRRFVRTVATAGAALAITPRVLAGRELGGVLSGEDLRVLSG